MSSRFLFRLRAALAFFSLLLFSEKINAQWEPRTSPGGESVYNIWQAGDLWLTLTESGLYRSGDDGLSWAFCLPVDYTGAAVAEENGTIWALVFPNGLYHSENQGQSWALYPGTGLSGNDYPEDLEVAGNYLIYKAYRKVFRFDKNNPGAPEEIFNYPNFSWNTPSILIATQGQDLWLTANDSLLRSPDGGTTWNLVHEGWLTRAFGVHNNTLLLYTDSGLKRSSDYGQSWEDAGVVVARSEMAWYEGVWLAVDYDQGLRYSSDDGSSWQAYAPALNAGFSLNRAAKKGATLLVTSGAFGLVRSGNNGANWELRNSGMAIDDFVLGPQDIYSVGNYLVYGRLFSEDQGATWFMPLEGSSNYPYFDSKIIEHNGVYYGMDVQQNLYRSDGNFHQWTFVSGPFTSSSLQQLFSLNGHFYREEIITPWNGTATAQMFESPDEGLSWNLVTVLSDASMLFAHKNWLFDWRGYYGLFRSADGGVSWQSVGAGLNDFSDFSDSPRFFSNANALYAYGYNGIAVSTNGGLTFTKINNTLLGDLGYPMGAENLTANDDYVIALTSTGFFISPALSDQWVNINANLPYADYFSDEHLILKDGFIYASLYDPKPVWRRSLASINIAQLSGKVWRDDNNNGQQDNGEPPYAGIVVRAGSNSFATSAADGTYQLTADLDTDTLRVQLPAVWASSNPAFYAVNTSASGRDFGLYFPPDVTDLGIQLTNQTVFRPGFDENIYLSYKNAGTATADAAIRFVAAPPLVYESALPPPDATSGDTLIWQIAGLPSFAGDHIIVQVNTPSNTPLFSTVSAWASITPTAADADLSDNNAWLHEYVVGSYDPNDKRCDHTSISPEQLDAGSPLVFTVRFQNTGTYPAEFVRITDTLDFAHLDVSSFRVLASSHPVQTTLSGNGQVEFFFDQIGLLPSNFDEPASHGFVQYEIRPKRGLSLGVPIVNTAYIYFDFNPAIVTNTTETVVAPALATHQAGQLSAGILHISPNPCLDFVRIDSGLRGPGRISITDALGRVVHEQKTSAASVMLNVGALPAGVYGATWSAESGGKETGKIIKP